MSSSLQNHTLQWFLRDFFIDHYRAIKSQILKLYYYKRLIVMPHIKATDVNLLKQGTLVSQHHPGY